MFLLFYPNCFYKPLIKTAPLKELFCVVLDEVICCNLVRFARMPWSTGLELPTDPRLRERGDRGGAGACPEAGRGVHPQSHAEAGAGVPPQSYDAEGYPKTGPRCGSGHIICCF